MKWTADKPTEAKRHYWFKPAPNPSGRTLLWVYEAEDDDGLTRLHANGNDGYGWVDDLEGEWAGPLPEPTD